MAEASGEPFKYTRSEIRALFGFRPTAFRKLEIKAGIIPAKPGSLPIGHKRGYDQEQLAKLAVVMEGRLGRYQLSYEPSANIADIRTERQALCTYFADRQAGARALLVLVCQQPLSDLVEELLRKEEPKYSPEDPAKGLLLRTILANNTPYRARKNSLFHSAKPAKDETAAS